MKPRDSVSRLARAACPGAYRARRKATAASTSRWWPAAACLLALAAAVVTGHFLLAGRPGLDRLMAASPPAQWIAGLTVEDAPPPALGLIVTSVRDRSEAAAAGISPGDRLVDIDGHGPLTLAQAARYLSADPRPHIVLGVVHRERLRRVELNRHGDRHHVA